MTERSSIVMASKKMPEPDSAEVEARGEELTQVAQR